MKITVLSDESSWLNDRITELLRHWDSSGHTTSWVHLPSMVASGDCCFVLSCSNILKPEVLSRNRHNLVVHESALPHGRGWSPLTWQILQGQSTIPVTLFEAGESVDSGPIYLQERITFQGHELIDELRKSQADATLALCRRFVSEYPSVVLAGRAQIGEGTYFPRRTPKDSRLDTNRSLEELFDLLRVVDNNRYPAFFDHKGHRYRIKIEKIEQAEAR